jgi:hypothetical protein
MAGEYSIQRRHSILDGFHDIFSFGMRFQCITSDGLADMSCRSKDGRVVHYARPLVYASDSRHSVAKCCDKRRTSCMAYDRFFLQDVMKSGYVDRLCRALKLFHRFKDDSEMIDKKIIFGDKGLGLLKIYIVHKNRTEQTPLSLGVMWQNFARRVELGRYCASLSHDPRHLFVGVAKADLV